MACEVVSTPDFVSPGGWPQTTLPGFAPIDYRFQRKDYAVGTVTEKPHGSYAGYAVLTIAYNADIEAEVIVGSSIYLYSTIPFNVVIYNGIYQILEAAHVGANLVFTLNLQHTTNTSTGFINWRPNHYMELFYLDAFGLGIGLPPLRFYAPLSGLYICDVSPVINKRTQSMPTALGLSGNEISFRCAFGEGYGTFIDYYLIFLDILTATWASFFVDNVSRAVGFAQPKIYVGYPSGVIVCRSNQEVGQLWILGRAKDKNKNTVGAVTQIGANYAGSDGGHIWFPIPANYNYQSQPYLQVNRAGYGDTGILFEVITPKSAIDATYADYEYLLAWFDRHGAYCQYMFTDWGLEVDSKSERLNGGIANYPNTEDQRIIVTAEELTRSDVEVIRTLFTARNIWRVSKDGTHTPIGTEKNKLSIRNSAGRYAVEIELVLPDEKIPR